MDVVERLNRVRDWARQAAASTYVGRGIIVLRFDYRNRVAMQQLEER
jgi:hypothetical protein